MSLLECKIRSAGIFRKLKAAGKFGDKIPFPNIFCSFTLFRTIGLNKNANSNTSVVISFSTPWLFVKRSF